MYLSTSTSTEDFPVMYLSTFQVLYKLYLSTDVLKCKVLLPGSGWYRLSMHATKVEKTNVLTRSSWEMHLQILYKLFITILSQKRTVIFATFSQFCSIYYISNKLLPKL